MRSQSKFENIPPIADMLPIISNMATEARCKVSKVSKGSKYNNSENFALPNMTHDIPDCQRVS